MSNSSRAFTFFLRLASFAFLVVVCAVASLAQTNKGTITGTVTDANGAAIKDASVKITNTETGAVREVTTGDEGSYNAPLLDIGIYTVEISAANFQSSRQENVKLDTAATLAIDAVLSPGQVTDVVTVTAEQPLVQTETSDRSSIVTGREVTELPLSGRNFTQLATLTPGVSRVTIGTLSDARANNNGDPNAGGQGPGGGDPRGSTESARFARSGGAVISANGQRPTNNNFSVDGVDNNEPQFGTIGVFVNPDAIAEFRVTTSVPPAEVGRAGGAVVNTSFKSGTNDFHGSLYYYGQNSALNAYHPILKRRRAEQGGESNPFAPRKAVQQIHEFGGTIGGPILRDRTFFFFDYLGGRNNLPTPLASTVPSALVRQGNFSEYDTPVLDPRTGLPFPGNIIPQNRISPVALNFFNRFPLPTRNIRNPGQFDNNFFSQRDVSEKIDNFDIKIDHRVTANNQLSGRYSFQNNANIRSSFFPEVPAGFGAGNEVNNTRQIVLTNTHTFTPTILNEFRFGYTKIDIGIINCGVGGECGISESFSDDIGVPNANNGTFEQSGSILVGGFGNGFVEFAGDGGPFIVNSKNPYFADTLTIVHGNHVTKFGGEARLRYIETIDGGRTGGLKGNLSYADNGPATGANPNCPPGAGTPAACFVDANGVSFGATGLAIASILIGAPALQTFRGSVPGGAFNLRSQEYGLFVQDDWKVNDKLTLNLGLRYDIFPAATEASGRLGNFNLGTGVVDLASGSDDSLIETDKNNFGPRVGFAYGFGADKTMVVRGGYGLLYTLDATDRPPLVQNPPFTNSVGFNNAFDASTPRSVFSLQTGPPNVPTVDPLNIPTSVRVFYVEPQQKTAYVHQFNLTYEWQFAPNWSIDVGYVGNRSRNLLATRDIGGGGTAEARNRAGQFLPASAYENRASAQYDGMQVQLRKRLSNNIQGQASYTWSHNIDDSTGVFAGIGEGRGSVGGPQNPFDLDAERGNSSLDVRHLLSANAIVDVPFGRGQRFFNESAVADKLLGGIQLNFILTARTGFPFSVVDGNGRRATQICDDPFLNQGDVQLNPACFIVQNNVVRNAAGTEIRFGNLGRNTFTTEGFARMDFSFFKNTSITERLRMQLGLEFFNVFNTATYTVPNQNDTDPGSFGRFDAALPARVVQYRLKFIF